MLALSFFIPFKEILNLKPCKNIILSLCISFQVKIVYLSLSCFLEESLFFLFEEVMDMIVHKIPNSNQCCAMILQIQSCRAY